jgi:hypothetical protein
MPPVESSVIVSEAKQSGAKFARSGDCFVAALLAMTKLIFFL